VAVKAHELVAMWARDRAAKERSHALQVRAAYRNEPLHGLCARYAAMLERHADEFAALGLEIEAEQP
jgi:predicted LPLAT superfamily acyltransferase